jgi:hypothetical protein
MKNINQLKVVLALILGLSCVVQGDQNDDLPYSSNANDLAGDFHADVREDAGDNPVENSDANVCNEENPEESSDTNVPNREDTRGNPVKSSDGDVYLFHHTQFYEPVTINNKGILFLL